MTQDALENKKEQLEEFERSEQEARRLDNALGQGKDYQRPDFTDF